MRVTLGVFIAAPVEEVFAFLDEPMNIVEFQEHAKSHLQQVDLVETLPDGRRTFDFQMRAGPRAWMQTVKQVLREPPTRLVSDGWTWTKDRDRRVLTLTSDRRLAADSDGTRLETTIETRLEHPWRNPFAVVVGWLTRGAFRLEQEHALHFMAEHIEAQRAGRRRA
jgi:hypothetical protein